MTIFPNYIPTYQNHTNITKNNKDLLIINYTQKFSTFKITEFKLHKKNNTSWLSEILHQECNDGLINENQAGHGWLLMWDSGSHSESKDNLGYIVRHCLKKQEENDNQSLCFIILFCTDWLKRQENHHLAKSIFIDE